MKMSRFLGAMMAAAALALGACASNDDSSRRSAGEFTSDAALTAKVKTAIASDAGIGNATAINVNSYRGVVQLSGFLDSKEKVDRAAEAARKVDGVTRVENSIQVKPAS
jgi:hyperosmotically inducible periplasmic protein